MAKWVAGVMIDQEEAHSMNVQRREYPRATEYSMLLSFYDIMCDIPLSLSFIPFGPIRVHFFPAPLYRRESHSSIAFETLTTLGRIISDVIHITESSPRQSAPKCDLKEESHLIKER